MSATDNLETAILAAVFQHTPLDGGVSLYIGLASAFTDSAYTEVPNTLAYARVGPITANATNFPIAGGFVTNGIVFTFPTPTGSWGTPGFVFVANSATWNSAMSTILAYQPIDVPAAMSGAPPPNFPIGQLKFGAD